MYVLYMLYNIIHNVHVVLQTYSHGEPVKVNISINNRSSKTVKKIRIQGKILHVEDF